MKTCPMKTCTCEEAWTESVAYFRGGEQWIALVGKMDGQPYEIFTGIMDVLNPVQGLPGLREFQMRIGG